ncbi:MAG: SDR family NAD(P)-dependent oxidoreductase [Pelatocladus maniniholoensis HA4357-MV3]|jgi:microcystin synthetase protein McyD|uniref:SDR family NAD(P)-dependent oxidoreductase n=1 Tax=Pelatocladus maniniholoensis HA4357-MV3 TaxID=1117104 RepID=A0A9E3H7Y6_9NOST|nr:SDR family NAD(P)-dependent oxidoreductase [Pelatocladus maniniholoensis HA4357-MV3]
MDISDNDKSIQTRVFKALNEAKEKLKAVEAKQSEPIAVVGLGCRFGKNVSTPELFWSFLKTGGNTLTNIPSDRWNTSDFYDSDRSKPGKIYVSQGGFLDDVSMFDPHFFGIAPREALHIDPQQRLLLEVAYEALENAGMAAPTTRIGKTGVFIGITNNDYARLIAPDGNYSTIGAYHISGNHTNAAAGRISYLLNLNGPSLAVDTACSSSLVAVHLACRSLRAQECRQALVGGVNLILTPEVPIALCKNQMLAADGRCKTFDASADGFGIGEGCGVVVLKRLSEALADGDRIWALIRGTAVNNDGASGGFTVPNGPVQTDLIREALIDARFNADIIDYVEAHGTGTSLGDPIEIKAIADALCVNRSQSQPLLVGSIKTNLGHLAAAAGISGLIKTVLSIYYSEIPAHLNLQTPNPHIHWDSLPINVVTQTRPWTVSNSKIKAAGVSSFGASGTNAHVILSEPPQIQSTAKNRLPVLITLSAKDEERLRLLANKFVDYVDQKSDVNLTDIAFSLNTGRFHYKQRLALLVSSAADFQEQLRAFTSDNSRETNIIHGEVQVNPKIAFLFHDQQAIFSGITKELFVNEPVFHHAFERCDRLFQNYLDFSIEDLVYKHQNIDDHLSVQPALFALQYAVCELWKYWGIRPAAVLGTGFGEYLAAQQAGVLALEDAVKLIATRVRLFSQNQNIDEERFLAFKKVAEEINYSNPQLTLIDVLNGEVASNSIKTAAYWVQHLHQSAHVAQGISTLKQMGYRIFIEIGNQPILTNVDQRNLSENEILWLCSLTKDSNNDQQIQTVLAELYVRGVNINWQEFHRSYSGQKISLPNSPFIRKRYWVDSATKSHHDHSGHPLLGDRFPSPLSSIQYQASISQHNPAFLAEHQVFGKPIFPGAAFIEMALAATEGQAVIVENIEFKKALILQDKADILQVILNQDNLQIYHQVDNNWDLLVAGEIQKLKSVNTTFQNLEQIAANSPEHLEINSFYQKYQKSGVNYGSSFQLINQLQCSQNTAFAEIKLTDNLLIEAKNYHFHPAMLDACFQAIAAILFQQESSVTYVPTRIAKFQFFKSPGDCVISAARLTESSHNLIISDIDIYSEQGELLVSIIGFELKAVQRQEILHHEIQPQSYIEEWIPLAPLLPDGRDTLVSPDVIKTQIKPQQLEQQSAEKLRQYECLLAEMESLSVTYIWEGLKQLNWEPELGQIYQEEQIAVQGGVVDFYRPLLSRCLAILAEEGILNQQQNGWLLIKEPEIFSSQLQIQHLCSEFPDYLAEINLIKRCASVLAEVMRRQIEPLELLFPQGDLNAIASVYADAAGAKLMNELVAATIRCAVANLPTNRRLRILEIGGGTGSSTAAILPHLVNDQIEYIFTDISSSFLTRAKENFSHYTFVKYQTLDIEKNPITQGFIPGSFDIIIAANVLHATADINKTLENVRSLIAPNALLILLESTGARRWVDLTFGLTEGWWLCSQDSLRNDYPLVDTERWQDLLTNHQFTEINVIEPSNPETRNLLRQSVIVAKGNSVCKSVSHEIIFADSKGIAQSLVTPLQQRGVACSLIFPQDINTDSLDTYLSLLQNLLTPETREIIYLWPLQEIAGEIYQTVEIHCRRFLFLIQALLQQENLPKLILVTQGSVPAKAVTTLTSPAQSSLLGIALSLILEHPELNFRAIDLDPKTQDVGKNLFREIYNNTQETRIALRGEERFCPRLVERKLADGNINFREDGYYLISGGTGGLGLATARWMIERGARHLVLCSRNGAKAVNTKILTSLQSINADIQIKDVDITDAEKLHTLLEECRFQYPVRGIFHIAGTLDDTTLLRLTPESFNHVLAPKVKGTWLLHQLTLNDPLDFFVCYTSAVSLIGSAGQANAAAANAFEDAFIYYRHAQNLPATAVNWGPWSEIGAAVDRNVLERLAAKGYDAIAPELALQTLEKILLNQIVRAGVIAIDWERFPYINQSFYQNFLPKGETKSDTASNILEQWQTVSVKQRRDLLIRHLSLRVSTVLGLSTDEVVSPQQGFFDMGMDSLTSTELRNLLQTDFNCSLPSTITFRFPNVETLADYFLREVLNISEVQIPVQKLIPEIPQIQVEKSTPKTPQQEEDPIVIVGMACRFPGGANDVESFWKLLEQGKDAVGEIPGDRWDSRAWYHPDPDTPGKIYSPYGAFLEQIDQFDAEFFGIIPREAVAIDPQQRLLLETTWQALESAGQNPQQLRNSQTGVFVGAMTQDYAQLSYAPEAINAYTGSGTSVSVAAGRLSYVLGLQGPSMTVDTACSSSLVAVHLACNALRNGECEIALAGGVNIILTPVISLIESRAHMLAPDGRCKTFDASANGMVRGEGCGMIVLKRLSQAIKNGDRILARVYGTAVNHDGPSSGLTVPNGDAQEKLLHQALKIAQLKPEQIDYIEAHGTGTAIGDPIELESMAAVFGKRPQNRPLIIGSVKTNLGHLEGAAGIAGLIKTVLALQHHKIPPHLHFQQPNPRFDWNSHIFEVPVHGKNWHSSERQRIAGVSSFGFSGTNSHVIVGEIAANSPQKSDDKFYLLPLSARSETSLQELAKNYQSTFNESVNLADACFTASTGRAVFRHRLCILANSITTVQQALSDFQTGEDSENLIRPISSETQSNVAFLFSGQGSQYSGMGQTLYNQEPVFRNTLDLCDQTLEPILETSLLDIIFELQNSELLEQTQITQPALFALEYSLAKLWQSWGIQPSALLGHSIGEYVAACLAGVFSLEDALQLVVQRGRLMGELPQNGAMAAIYADYQTVADHLIPYENQVNIAAANGAINVISGLSKIVDQLEKTFIKQGYKTRRLAVSHAFHSPLMEPMLDNFTKVLQKIDFHEPSLNIISNLTGKPIGKEIATPDYWLRHIRNTVHFGQGFKYLVDSGYRCFLELGSKPVLLGMARLTYQTKDNQNKDILWLPSIIPGQDEQVQMYKSLATLFVNGYSVEWTEVFKSGKRIPLPNYPFQRERYWLSNSQFSIAEIQTKLHPFISDFKKLATGEIIFEGEINSEQPDYLTEHKVFTKTIFPATGFIEAILTASQKIFTHHLVTIKNVLIHQGLLLSSSPTTLQMIFKSKKSLEYSFEIFSSNSAKDDWILHVTGEIKPHNQKAPASINNWSDLKGESVAIPKFYELYQQMGITYGERFQAIQELRYLGNGSQAQISIDRSLVDQRYCLHPVLLDACLQSIGAAFPEIHGQELHLPYGFSSLELFENPGSQAETRIFVKSDTNGEMRVDVEVYDQQEQLCARFIDLVARRTNPAVLQHLWQESEKNWFYQVKWQKLNSVSTVVANTNNSWLIFVYPDTALHQLTNLLKQAGERVITVELGEDYKRRSPDDFVINSSQKSDFKRLYQEAYPSGEFPTGVIFIWENAPMTEYADTVSKSCHAALNLIQTITTNWQKLPDLWLVTRNANQILAETSIQPQQSWLWGLGAVINQEYPQMRCVCLDLSPTEEADEAEFLFQELHTFSSELRLALRQGNRYGARLVSATIPPVQKQDFVSKEGAYLITGGLGKLGLLLAQWLSKMGASHLVLCSRNVKSSPEAIASLRQNGTQVTIISADITSAVDIEQIFFRFGKDLPPLRGVIHAAGVLDDGLLSNQNWQRYENVMRPKIEGTLLLDRYTRNLFLDFFITFSSAAVILGSPGQSNYAAANAFMDALMQQRQSLGLPGININWGAWDTENEIEKQRFAIWGIQSMSSDIALKYLSQLIMGNVSQGVIIDIDWSIFNQNFNINQPFFTELLTTKENSQNNSAKLLEQLKSVSIDERAESLSQGIEQILREVTGLTASSIVPHQTSFLELGLNSLMVLEFKNKLESNLACNLPASIIFDYPHITSLSIYLREEVLAEHINFEMKINDSSDTLNPYDSLNEDELAVLLNQKLAELDKYDQ